MVKDVGFLHLATVKKARGSMYSARGRVQQPGEPTSPIPVSEDKLYSQAPEQIPASLLPKFPLTVNEN